MKIVHITGYYPPHLGGMEYRIQELSEMSEKRNHDVEIITSDMGCKTGKIPSRKNLRVHYLKSIEFAHTPISPMLFFRLMRIPRDSAIHLHIAHALIPEITWLVCTIRRIPYMATVHLDVSTSGFFGFLLPLYKKLFLSPVLRGAQTITVLTEDYKNLISEKYAIPKNRITVIPNGTHFKPPKKKMLPLHRPARLLFVGRLSVQKNIPLLINAFHICITRYKLLLHLYITGSGEKEQETRQLIQKKRLENYTTLLGGVSAAQAQKLYHSSDIFILPSRAESFGTVIIEAMASGIPVIATNILAVRNTIRHGQNGLLVDETPEALAQTIRMLVKNAPLRRKLMSNGLQDVKKYNWETVTDQFEDCYRNMVRKTNK